MILSDGSRFHDLAGAIGIIGVSEFLHINDLPDAAIDASSFIDMMLDLEEDGFLLEYEFYWAIDGTERWTTHNHIYKETTEAVLNELDINTDGDDRVIILIRSHGANTLTVGRVCVYDTLPYIFSPAVTEVNLGGYIDGMTSEGTRVFFWMGFCQGAHFEYLWNDYIHNNRAHYWGYDPEGSGSMTGSLREFYYFDNISIRIQKKTDIAQMFPIVKEGGGENMFEKDYLAGSLYLGLANEDFDDENPNGWGVGGFTNTYGGNYFVQSSDEYWSPPYAVRQYGGWGSIFSTWCWQYARTFSEAIISIYFYRDHYNSYATVAIRFCYLDEQNYYQVKFYGHPISSIYVQSMINGELTTIYSYSLGESFHRKWWHVKIELTTLGSDDWIKISYAKKFNDFISLPYQMVSQGNLDNGYLCLFARIGSYGSVYWDEVEFLGL